jgi:release factor glutamine methyltransferase
MSLPLRKVPTGNRRRGRRTIAQEIAWASRAFARAGRRDSQKLALVTWAALAGTTPGEVWLAREGHPPSEQFARRYREAVSRQAAGAPLQYAVGRAAFRTLELEVAPAVLIPRVETEGLVDLVLSWSREHLSEAGWGTAADIGTGSGAIALSLAVEGRFQRVIATDLSAEALALADSNRERLEPGTPVEFRRGSLVEPLRDGECEVIVSNPPYLSTGEWKRAARDVRDYEPALALDGGADGLRAYRVLLRESARCLSPGGLLALELDFRRAADVHAMAVTAGWGEPRIVRDVFDRDRYLLASKFARIP